MTERPLKVGFLSFPWPIPPTAYGGIERAVDGLCRGLHKAGHDVKLWAATSSTCPVDVSGVIDYATDSDTWHSPPIELQHVLAGYEWLNSEGVDVIHDITFAGPLVGATLTDRPIVTTNYLPFTPPEPAKGHSFPDLSLLYQTIAERVPVLAISQAQADDAVGFTPHTIHLGLDIENIPIGSGAGDDRGAYAAFYARMAPEKGAKTAILAAKEAGIRLKIVTRIAEAHEVEYFKKEVEPLIDGDLIELVGELSIDEGYRFLGEAEVTLHPIAWPDTFGTSTVESLACGTPVVAYDLGAVGEVVENGVTGMACKTFAQFVEALTNYKSFKRESCRASAAKGFSNTRVVNDHVNFYRSMVDQASTSR